MDYHVVDVSINMTILINNKTQPEIAPYPLILYSSFYCLFFSFSLLWCFIL